MTILDRIKLMITGIKNKYDKRLLYFIIIILILIIFNYEILTTNYLNFIPIYFIYMFVLTLSILNTFMLFNLVYSVSQKELKINSSVPKEQYNINKINKFVVHQNRSIFLKNFSTIVKKINHNEQVDILGIDLVHFLWTEGVPQGIENAIIKKGLRFRILIMNPITSKENDAIGQHKLTIKYWRDFYEKTSKNLENYCRDYNKELTQCLDIRISEEKPVSFIMMGNDYLIISPYIITDIGKDPRIDIPLMDIERPEGNLLEVYRSYFQAIWASARPIKEFVASWDLTN